MISSRAVLKRLNLVLKVKTDSELANALQVRRSTLGNWRTRNSIPYIKCMQIASEKNISLDWLLGGENSDELQNEGGFHQLEEGAVLYKTQNLSRLMSDFVLVDQLKVNADSAGIQGCGTLQARQPIAFSRQWLQDRGLDISSLSLAYVGGDAMEPELRQGDIVLIDQREKIQVNGATYVCLYDGVLYIKKWQWEGKNQCLLISCNPQYRSIEIDLGQCKTLLQVIGRVVWYGRSWI